MRYAPIDDNVDDEPEAQDVPAPETPKDLGDFSRQFGDHLIWFVRPKPGQVNALNRLRASAVARTRGLRTSGKTDAEMVVELGRISFEFDNLCLDLVEALLADKDNASILSGIMIRGEMTAQEIIAKVLYEESEADDDEAPKPKPAKKAKAARPAKKASVASAGRSRR